MRFKIRDHDDAVLHGHAEQGDEAHAAGDIEVLSGEMQGYQSAERGQRHHAQDQQRLAQRSGADGEKDQHESHHQSQDDQQPCLGAALILELATPFQADGILVEMHFLRDLRLRLLQIAGQVAVAVVDADGQIALAVLARHRALARTHTHIGDLRQRDLRAARGLDGQIAERLGAVA
jgi:hypothetical protein